jgi:hypothetical protein
VLELLDIHSSRCRCIDEFRHSCRHHHQIEIEADYGFGIGVDGQAADDTVVGPGVLQHVQQQLEDVDLAVGNAVEKLLARHR